MKVVLDTNVFVSGLMFSTSVPGSIIGAWRQARFDIVLAIAQLGEIGRVLAYPKIRRVLKWDDERIGRFLRQLYLRCEVVDVSGVFIPATLRDRDDAPILAALIGAKADVLVTGDRDLLALRDRYAILSPAEFVRKF